MFNKRFFQKYFILIKMKTKILYGHLYCAFFENNEHKWMIIRSIFSYLFGIFLAILFWEFIILDFQFDTLTSYKILLILITLLGLGCTYSKKCRCISSLICAEFSGRAGRSLLRALIFTFILDGPIANLSTNAKDVAKVFTCATMLTFNLTQTRFNLMTKPLQSALFEMKKNTTDLRKCFESIDNVTKPLFHEIESQDINDDNETANVLTDEKSLYRRSIDLNGDVTHNAEMYENNYKEKLRKRCEFQLEKGTKRCKQAFDRAYKDCHKKLPSIVNTILCWPMRITVICNLNVFGFSKSKICDPTKVVNRDFGQNYDDLKQIENTFMSNITKMNVTYEILSPRKLPGVMNAEQTAEVFSEKFKSGKSVFDKCIYITKKILAFIFVKVIFGAIKYHNKYLSDINSDNIYITSYFKKIDSRRKEKDQRSLLPLKKVESLNIIDPSGSKRSKAEKSRAFLHLLKLGLELATACLFLLFDHIIYVLLDTVRENAEIDYVQRGEHILVIDVNGTGIIARLVRRTLRNFNVNATVHTVLTNKPCLPNPNKLPIWFYFKLLILCGSIALMIFNESFFSRMKRAICSYFYPLREKKRIIHLYNQLLKRRRSLFAVMLEEIKRQLLQKRKVEMKINILAKIRIIAPWLFGWLRNFSFARRQCLLCREVEPKVMDDDDPNKLHFINCKNKGCFYVYCEECWQDAGEMCLACNRLMFQHHNNDILD